jgi:chromate transport protein ChrA
MANRDLVDVPITVIFVAAFALLWRFKIPEPAVVGASALVGLVLFSTRSARRLTDGCLLTPLPKQIINEGRQNYEFRSPSCRSSAARSASSR